MEELRLTQQRRRLNRLGQARQQRHGGQKGGNQEKSKPQGTAAAPMEDLAARLNNLQQQWSEMDEGSQEQRLPQSTAATPKEVLAVFILAVRLNDLAGTQRQRRGGVNEGSREEGRPQSTTASYCRIQFMGRSGKIHEFAGPDHGGAPAAVIHLRLEHPAAVIHLRLV